MEHSEVLTIVIIAGLINLAILFAVIYYAINYANKPIKRLLRILITMKGEELKKQGIDPNKAIEDVDELDSLIKQLSNAQISQQDFNYKAEKYLI